MGDWNMTVPTILGGDTPLGDDWDSILKQLVAMSGPSSVYSTTWAASVGSPVLGNGSLTTAYNRFGKWLYIQGSLLAGTTTTFGTAGAFWTFTLPSGLTSARTQIGSGLGVATGVKEWPVVWRAALGSTTIDFFQDPGGRFTNTSPFTFANTHTLDWSGWLEIS
jgi:hypothetical protein